MLLPIYTKTQIIHNYIFTIPYCTIWSGIILPSAEASTEPNVQKFLKNFLRLYDTKSREVSFKTKLSINQSINHFFVKHKQPGQ